MKWVDMSQLDKEFLLPAEFDTDLDEKSKHDGSFFTSNKVNL